MQICLSIALLLISGLYSNLTLDPVLLPRFLAWSVFVMGSVLIITFKMTKTPTGFDFSIIHRAIFPAIICYLAVSGLSLINAINLAEGLFEWLKLFLFTAFFYTAVLIILRNSKGIRNLVRSIILAAAILSVIGIFQYYQLAFTFIPGNYVIYATMAHKNLFASALFLMLPFVAYGLFAVSSFWRIMSIVALVLILVCIFLTRARTVWLAIFSATVILSIIWAVKNRKIGVRRLATQISLKIWIIPFLLGTTAVLSIAWSNGHDKYRAFTSNTGNKIGVSQIYPFKGPLDNLNTMYERLFVWEKTLEMVKDNPFLGVGLGQWRLVFPAYGRIQKFRQSEDGMAEITFKRPHNDYMWILSESGITGLINYLAVLGISIFYALKIIFRSGKTESRTLAYMMLFGIVGYMVIAFFSFPKERIVHNIYFMLILACILSAYHRSFPKPKDSRFAGMLFINISAVILLAFCVMVGYIRLNSEIHVKEALKARKAGDWQKVIHEIDKSDTYFYPIDPVGMPLTWYRGIANYSKGNLQEARQDFEKAYCKNPNQIHVLNNLGASYAMLGNYRKAAEFYKKAIDIWPGFDEARINLDAVYRHAGNS